MTTPSELGTLRTEIDELKAKILKTEEALAAAQSPDIEFLRKQLEQLNNTRNLLQEEENILLRGQASGEYCLPCHLLPSVGYLHAHFCHVIILSKPQTTRRVLSVLLLVPCVMHL